MNSSVASFDKFNSTSPFRDSKIFVEDTVSIALIEDNRGHEQQKSPTLIKRIKSYLRQKLAIKPHLQADPRLLSPHRKRCILACLSFGASLNGFCSTVFLPGIPDITADLHATKIEITLVSSLFTLFGGIGPICWASISDYYYIRRFLYLIGLFIFAIASICCALANKAYLLILFRCFQSVGASVSMSVGAGTVADCWQLTERGSAFSFLFVGQFLGPLIGPIIGGGITTGLGWRGVFWLCSGYGVFLFVFFFLVFPETYRLDCRWDEQKRGVYRQQQQEEKKTSFNPFKSFFLMKHLFVSFIAIEIGFCFGTMFTLETLIPDLYYTHYGFDSWQTGLSFLGAGVANVLGSFISGRLSDYLLIRSAAKRGGVAKAEDRLTLNAWPGGFIIIPFGALLFGWSIMAGFSVWPAIIGFSVLCFGMSQVYTAGSAYLVDAIPGKGASTTAACNFFRMTTAAILSFISPIIGAALSIGYVTILLASLNVVGMCLLVVIKYKGIHMRRKEGFAEMKNDSS